MENMKNVKVKGEGIYDPIEVCGEKVCLGVSDGHYRVSTGDRELPEDDTIIPNYHPNVTAKMPIKSEDCPGLTEPRAESIINIMQEADRLAISAYIKAMRIHNCLDGRIVPGDSCRAEPTSLVNHIAIHKETLLELCRELDAISDIIGC